MYMMIDDLTLLVNFNKTNLQHVSLEITNPRFGKEKVFPIFNNNLVQATRLVNMSQK